MKVLFPAFRVSDLDASLAFYALLGFEVVGRVEGGDATLVMLALHGHPEVSLELVRAPARGPVEPGGFDHLAVQVDDVRATRDDLRVAGLDIGRVETPGGPGGPHTATLVDPDGYHLELVQWPPEHPVGMTRADFETRPPARPDADPKDTSR